MSSSQIRGAPAIASLAALSLRSHLSSTSVPSFVTVKEVQEHNHPILDYLQSSRPTAVNLGEAMDRIRATLQEGDKLEGQKGALTLVESVKDVCTAVHGEDLERCVTMGRHGAEWLWKRRGEGKKGGLKIVTVCNTGSLATSVGLITMGIILLQYADRYRDTARPLESSLPFLKPISSKERTMPKLRLTTRALA